MWNFRGVNKVFLFKKHLQSEHPSISIYVFSKLLQMSIAMCLCVPLCVCDGFHCGWHSLATAIAAAAVAATPLLLLCIVCAEVTCAWNAYLNSNDECIVCIVTPPGLLGG